MEPGYGIALALEAAGLFGLALGLLRLRAERRARAAELSAALRPGTAARRRSSPALRIVALPAAPARAARAGSSASSARAALHRAVAPRRPIAA
ncbi:hypothetical protein Q8W71_14500 [Methylobacterium sp. NEAU 140]|uniref:hypothetical protein n=1 Tax=Methylobacterium sp. NEAU 140 TaxID=3064945 RepID=UPI0027368E4F|nr:hypothetical protein [Methylobacterium sp. NEAU 140]MDP4023842.1 hypothetical protein [Methylobacterium sp. NEAU 140]